MKRKLLLAALCVVGCALGMRAQSYADISATALLNPSFELQAEGTVYAADVSSGATPYGWTVNTGIQSKISSSTTTSIEFTNGQGGVTPKEGTFFYESKVDWAYGSRDGSISTTTNSLEPGLYYTEVYFKAADICNNDKWENGTALGITVTDANNTTLISKDKKRVAYSLSNSGGGTGTDVFLAQSQWDRMGVMFKVSTAGSVTITFNQTLKSRAHSELIYDNVKLYRIYPQSTPDGATALPIDVAGVIDNANFATKGKLNWTDESNNIALGGLVSNYCAERWNATFDLNQTVTGLRNGKYVLTCQAFYRAGDKGSTNTAKNAKLYAGTNESDVMNILDGGSATSTGGFDTQAGSVYVPNSMENASRVFSTGAYSNNSVSATVTTGTLKIGIKKSTGITNDWTLFDNFQLKLVSPSLDDAAEALPSNGEMVAGHWYYYDVAVDGDYKFNTADLSKVVYTTDATENVEDAVTSITTTPSALLALSVGRVYVKASENLTMTIKPNILTYTIGDATTSLNNNAYIQNLTTVTYTYSDATTNDEDAALSIIDGEKVATLYDSDDNPLTTGTLTSDGNVLTATFSYSGFTAGSDYKLSLPSGAFGYNADNTNTAVDLTLHTTVLLDGIFFMKDADGKYISRGGDSNTEATLDEFGIAVNITTDVNNVTMVQYIDNERYMFGGSKTIYTDRVATDDNVINYGKWTVTSTEGKYNFYNTGRSKFITSGTGAESGVAAVTYADDAYGWTLEAPAAHPAQMATYKDANAAAVATAAGLSATTVAQLKTALADNFTEGTENLASSAYSTVTEKYQPAGYTEKIIEQSLTGLSNGIYKVSIFAFHRIKDNAGTYNYHLIGADNPTSYLYANGQKMQLPSSMSEYSENEYTGGTDPNWAIDNKNYPNNTTAAGQAFDAGFYKVEVFAVVTDGTLKIGLTDPGKYTDATWQYTNWICWRDLTVTAYTFNGDYTDLATAISTAENNLGFESGEYAPYNNIESMGKLAAAKALYASQDAINQDAIDEVTEVLTTASWTNANEEEVNAIYDGDFNAAKDNVASNTLPTGWHGSDSHYSEGYWVRYVYGTSSSNAGLTHFENGSGMMSKSTPRYGLDEGYTMPLKANTYYKISFDYAGWNSQLVTTVVITDGDGNDVTVTPATTETSANAGQTNTTDWKSYEGFFKTNAAGDYVLKFNKTEHDGNGGQVAYGAIKLFRAPEVTANMTVKAGKYGTFIAPFEVTIPTDYDIEAYTVAEDDVQDNVLVLSEALSTIPANTPVVLKNSDSGDFSQSFSGQSIATADSYTEGLLTGVYTAATIASTEQVDNYVLQTQDAGQAFYKVTSDFTATPNRCYLSLQKSGANVRALFFPADGDATGIEAIGVLTSGNYDAIYTAGGAKVNSLQKGLNIVVKDGKSYKIFVK